MKNPKKNLTISLFYILYLVILILTHYDVFVVMSFIEIFDNANADSFGIFFFGWVSFLILLIANIAVFKNFFRSALGYGIFAYLPILANYIIILNYNYRGSLNFSLLIYIFIFIALSIVNLLIFTSIKVVTKADKAKIKKVILNLGTRFTRLEIGDISEKSNLNVKKVEEIIIEMIENKEIYAAYQENTKIVRFNQEANLEEIDKLLHTYENWEKDSNKRK